MAKVPQYAGPQLVSKPLPTPNLSPGVAAAEGQQISQAGQSLSQVSDSVERIQVRKDSDDAFRAETAAKADWLNREADLRRSMRGKSAEGFYTETEKFWADAPAKYGADLSPRARAMIGKSLTQARNQSLASARSWQEQELDRAFVESATANVGVEIQRAVSTGDPASVAASVAVIQRNIAEVGARYNWDANQVEQETLKHTTRLHKDMTSMLAERSPAEARAYLDNAIASGEVSAEYQDDLNKLVKVAEVSDESVRNAAAWASLPYEQQLANVAKIKDPDLMRATHQQVRQNQADRQAVDADRKRIAGEEAYRVVADGGKVADIPLEVRAGMDPQDLMQLDDYATRRAERKAQEAAGMFKVSEPEAAREVMLMPPNELAAMRPEQLATYEDRLGKDDYDRLLAAHVKAKDPSTWNEISSETEEIKLYTAKLNDTESLQFMQAYWAEKAQYMAKNDGRMPPAADREKIYTRLRTIDYRMSNRPLYERDRDEWVDADIDIEDDDRQAIRDTMNQFYARGMTGMGVFTSDLNKHVNAARKEAGLPFSLVDESDAEDKLYRVSLGLPLPPGEEEFIRQFLRNAAKAKE